jgi:DNA-binding winged helix-turn-helix (wHTH) protein/DNA-binding CsgD family transcriptional regulator
MQPQKTDESNKGSKRHRKVQQGNLLLIGPEEGFEGIPQRLFSGQRFRISGRSTTLLEGLFCLEFEAIDVVLLSGEFREEERSLFAFDAQRRGFTGLILHVVFVPNDRALSDGRDEQQGKVEAKEKPVSHPDKRHQARTQWSTLNAQAAPAVDGPRGALSFTDKEQAVLTRVSEGWSNPQIASHLECSEGSVKAIVQQLFDKLGVRKRTQIVRLAFERVERSPLHGLERQLAEDKGPALLAHADSRPAESHRVQLGDFVIDSTNRRVWAHGEESKQLTTQEFKLMTLFSRHPQELLRHDDLIQAMWDNKASSRESLRALVHAVRGKIERTERPRYILTVPHVGYRFTPSP